jgi:hypothetical protein
MPFDTIERTRDWFATAIPHAPDRQLYVQMGVHFEEVGEMIEELTPINSLGEALRDNAIFALAQLATHLKDSQEPALILHEGDRKMMLDALCDQIVTATGVGYFAGMRVPCAMKEVNRSNYSKFDTDGKPVFKDNGKIGKGPNYTEPDLTPYI